MSERAAAFGINGPKKTIEHNGKVYSAAPVLTHRLMLTIEARVFERSKSALADLKDMFTPDEYRAEAAALLAKRQSGGFAFESEGTQSFLETMEGRLTVTAVLLGIDTDEAIALALARPDELKDLVEEITEDSFPTAKGPKA